MSEFNGYELSRDWFDFCFENPDMISPTHTALYFFAIEHCNRLGWKQKFGLPTQMSMDAIGVKNWRTFSKAFNDIVDWGFFKLIKKSKNQYSSTVIAIVKNTKASTKALTKAMQKHGQKHDNSIVVINKPNNNKHNNTPLPPKGDDEKKTPEWKSDYDNYVDELRGEYTRILEDKDWVAQQEKLNPGVNIQLSIEKACVNYWSTKEAWNKKKRQKIESINWKSTFANAVSQSMNRVYKNQVEYSGKETKQPEKPNKW